MEWHPCAARAAAGDRDKLNREFNRIADTPEVKEKALAQGTELASQTPEQFGAFLVTQTTKWVKVAKVAGMRAD